MTESTINAELRGYHPGNASTVRSDADYIIPREHLAEVDVGERAEEFKDSAKITIDNAGGRYTADVTHGDRVEFYVQMDPVETTGYGAGAYGSGPYGSPLSHRWSGIIRPYSIKGEGAHQYTLEVTGEDFVYAVLGMRNVYDSFRDHQIVGPNGIVNTILENEAPEVDRSRLPSLRTTTDITVAGTSLLDVIIELADRANCLLAAQGTTLLFQPAGELQSQFVVEPSDFGTYSVKSNDDHLINQWRVDGGSDIEVDDVQETVDGYQTVTDASRIQTQIDHPKSEVAQVEIWTRPTGSGDGVRVRLQKDAGGAPEAPGETKKDLARRTLDGEFLEEDGWTTFLLPENDTPGATPWLLIEGDGAEGQEIGINTTSGDPAYRAYYSYPIDVSLPDGESQDRYRRREDRVKDDSLNTFRAAEDTARARLRKTAQPRHTVTVDAASTRMHGVQPGDIVTFDAPQVEAVGHFAVTERSDTYVGSTLETTITAQELPPSFAEDVAPPPSS